MNNQSRALRSIMWDYSIPEAELKKLLIAETTHAGHYTREKLFIKILNSLPWFKVLEIIPARLVKEMLSEEVISSLWPASVKAKYTYVRKRLQEALPDPA
ncbi:MAG: hypothetical protein U0T82_07220 [Bacteroidales bacterium]